MDGYSSYEKLKIRVYDKKEEKEHFHQEIELLYLLEGTMELAVADRKIHLETDDIIVVNANKKHGFRSSDDILFAQLSIAYEMVSDIFQTTEVIFWCDSTKGDNEQYAELRNIMKKLLNHYLGTQGNAANFGHIALCYQVMDLLSANFLVQAADKENLSEEDRYEYRIMQINNYIRANYQQQISIKELSEKLFLSNGYLSRFFKKNYGMSFVEYLTSIRLYHAVDEILYSEQPITKIAYDNGFTNIAMFNKNFKKAYGETPSEMRKKAVRQKKVQEIQTNIEAVERLEQYMQRNGQRLEKKEITGVIEAEHSMIQSRPLKYVWNQMINGGSASDMLRSEVREHIILLKEALHFKYVRFWNIFSDSMLIDISIKNGEYNFSQIDSILDFLIQQGLKPVIELGQKPRRIQENIQDRLVFENNRVKFASISHWDDIICSVFRHIIHKYGHAETAEWMVELWYDEVYAENFPEQYDYFELFNHTYKNIRKYSNDILVGGCGFQGNYTKVLDTEFLEKWKQEENRTDKALDVEFLKKWKQQECMPDFLSCMYFAYERGEIHHEVYSKRSTDNDGFVHMVQKTQENMETAGFGNMKLFITEWNMTISDRNFLNDSCFKGAYIIKNILDIYDKVDMAAYFVGSDRVTEYCDTGNLLFGGTGLVTKDGILKPAGFAIEFLNRLYPYVTAKGNYYLITTDRNDNYGIICHNQKKLNYNYYFMKENEVEKDGIWKYFEDREPLELKFHLTGINDGEYKAKIYCINDSSGSVMHIWQELDFEKDLSRNDIKYFRRVCEPKLSIKKIKVEGGVIDFKLNMEANEIVYIRISRQF